MNTAFFTSPLLPGPVVFEDVRGVATSIILFPRQGYNGHFYVYLQLKVAADRALPQIPLEQGGQPVRGSLTVEGDLYSRYEFPEIDFNCVSVRVTPRERVGLYEFRAPRDVTDNLKAYKVPTLDFHGQAPPRDSRLGDRYRFAIDKGDMQNLLEFEAIPSVADAGVVRFKSLSTDRAHSFLHQGVETHGAWVRNRKQKDPFPPFTVKFSQYDFRVTADLVERIHVLEASGSLLDAPTPELADLISAHAADRPFARLTMPALTAAGTLGHGMLRDETDTSHQRVVQTASLVYVPGALRDLVVV